MGGIVDFDPWESIVEELGDRPRMLVSTLRYDVFCAFIIGFGIGRDDGVLLGFTEWLARRQAKYKNYGLVSMVLAEARIHALGEIGQRPELSAEEDARARAELLALLRLFLTETGAAPVPD